MCAKDRSQNAFASQTDSIQSVSEMLNISSSLSFIRNSCGELIRSSPLFDKMFLTNRDINSWLASLPIETGMELVGAEIGVLTECSACIVKDVCIDGYVWNVFIESMFLKNESYTKWVFVRESHAVVLAQNSYSRMGRRINAYLSNPLSRKDDKWKILSLYAIGLTHSKIANLTGVSEKTSKNIINEFNKEFSFESRDKLILSFFYSMSYHRLALNVVNVLKFVVDDMLN